MALVTRKVMDMENHHVLHWLHLGFLTLDVDTYILQEVELVDGEERPRVMERWGN